MIRPQNKSQTCAIRARRRRRGPWGRLREETRRRSLRERRNVILPGQYFDTETELHYNYFRDYDAVTGRYIQSDPIGLRGGINTYLYAAANPAKVIDPLGLWSLSLSFYRGVGGAVAFGYDDGKWFLLGDAGFGLGAGVAFNPTGGFPRPEDACVEYQDEGFIGFQGTAGVNVGPLGLGGTGYTGGHIAHDPDGELRYDFVEGFDPFGRLRQANGSFGLGIQLSGGVRAGFTF